nr:hypothetical protein [Armatimonas sp.]
MRELGPTSLPELVKDAEVIALAKVERLHEIGGEWFEYKKKKIWLPGAKVGEAIVLRSLRGAKIGQRIAIAGYITWICDATELSTGELAIFFLTRTDQRSGELSPQKSNPHFNQQLKQALGNITLQYIAHSGQGKLAAKQVGTEFALVATKRFAPKNRPGNQLSYECAMLNLPSDVPFTPLTTPPTASQRERYRLYAQGHVHAADGLVPLEAIERKLKALIASSSQ